MTLNDIFQFGKIETINTNRNSPNPNVYNAIILLKNMHSIVLLIDIKYPNDIYFHILQESLLQILYLN